MINWSHCSYPFVCKSLNMSCADDKSQRIERKCRLRIITFGICQCLIQRRQGRKCLGTSIKTCCDVLVNIPKTILLQLLKPRPAERSEHQRRKYRIVHGVREFPQNGHNVGRDAAPAADANQPRFKRRQVGHSAGDGNGPILDNMNHAVVNFLTFFACTFFLVLIFLVVLVVLGVIFYCEADKV